MAELNFPSMFDTRYAMDRQIQTDAHAAGIAGGKGKRYGMYYNSSLLGDRDNAGLMNLAGMFGGGDPRMQQQQALDEIMQRFPDPQTPEDFVEIANALQGMGLHSYASKAREMANEVRTSMPERKTIKGADGFNYYVDTGERVLPGVTKTVEPDKVGWQDFPSTNEEGQDITEKWLVNTTTGDKISLESSQITNAPAVPNFDENIKQAVLDSYIHTETQKLRVANSQPLGNAQRLSEEEIITAGEANGRVEYNRVENAPAEGSPSVFSEKLAVWDAADEDRRKELVATGFFDGDAVQVTIENAINTKGQDAYAQKMGELTAGADLELVKSIKPAMITLKNTQEVFRLLDDEEITTGLGATLITNAKRMGNTVMRLLGQDNLVKEDVSKDQYLEALLGSQVFAMIKTLGIGARGLDTPAERDFLIQVMTGKRSDDKGAIKRLTRLRQEIAAEAVNIYNEKIANGSLDNFIILDRNLKDDGSDDFKAKLAQAKIEMTQEVPELYSGTWDRPVEHEIVVWDGEDTEYVSWDNRYYDSENREISWEDLNRILNPRGGQ
jgi:hypothetical protein